MNPFDDEPTHKIEIPRDDIEDVTVPIPVWHNADPDEEQTVETRIAR